MNERPPLSDSRLSAADAEAAPTSRPAPLIDRLVAPFGARRLVAGRPGMGWLLTEVSPAQLWCALTGALWLDGYNFVLYLTLLGASVADLAWLPLVNYGGFALSVLFLALRPPRSDAKAICVSYTFIARSLWLGVVVWPLMAWWLGLGTGAVLTGVFVAVFLTALFGNVGVAAFMTWTAAVVPREERGRFFMWRNLSAFAALTVTLHGVAWWWPVAGNPLANNPTADHSELTWLMGLFTVATVFVILSTFALKWSPALPPRHAAARTTDRRPGA